MSFFKNLEDFMLDLKNENITDEWYLNNFIEDNVDNLQPFESFDILKNMFPYILKYQKFSYEIISILQALKIKSDTNEKFFTDDEKFKILSVYANDQYCLEILNYIL